MKKAAEVREVAGETRNRGLACFFYRGPDSKYFKLCGRTVSVVPLTSAITASQQPQAASPQMGGVSMPTKLN